MPDTHIKLYHFTAVESWPAIRAAGLINPSLPWAVKSDPSTIAFPPVVWLTNVPSHKRARPPIAELPDKSAVRITVRVPRYRVLRSNEVIRKHHAPAAVARHFRQRAGHEWTNWYACMVAIPAAWWLLVEFDGMTLWRPEAARLPERGLTTEQFDRLYSGRVEP